jgi:hypothetical protein
VTVILSAAIAAASPSSAFKALPTFDRSNSAIVTSGFEKALADSS